MNKWHKIGLAVGLGAATITTAHLINKLIIKTATANNVTKDTTNEIYKWRFGDIAYLKKGEGSPLLLVHDLQSYSSSYEWDNVINMLSENHTVYAIDLLGCGHSEKPSITYTTFMYTQLLNDFITKVIKKKTDVIVTGDSAPIAIMTAYTNKDIIDRIVMISPQSVKDALKAPDKNSNIRKILINIPVIGTCVYNILMNKSKLQNKLAKTTFDLGVVPTDVLNAYYENSHLNNAFSKFLYISKKCHYTTVTIGKALSELDNLLYIINGLNSCEYKSYNSAIEDAYIEDAKKLPQVEQPVEFVKQVEIFLS